jgi:hypothetical protein
VKIFKTNSLSGIRHFFFNGVMVNSNPPLRVPPRPLLRGDRPAADPMGQRGIYRGPGKKSRQRGALVSRTPLPGIIRPHKTLGTDFR